MVASIARNVSGAMEGVGRGMHKCMTAQMSLHIVTLAKCVPGCGPPSVEMGAQPSLLFVNVIGVFTDMVEMRTICCGKPQDRKVWKANVPP